MKILIKKKNKYGVKSKISIKIILCKKKFKTSE